MLQKCYGLGTHDLGPGKEGKRMMILGKLPLDGLFIVYERNDAGKMERLFSGISAEDVPPAYWHTEVKRIYPYNDAIIIEIN